MKGSKVGALPRLNMASKYIIFPNLQLSQIKKSSYPIELLQSTAETFKSIKLIKIRIEELFSFLRQPSVAITTNRLRYGKLHYRLKGKTATSGKVNDKG